MMTIHPLCPRCSEPDLHRVPGTFIQVTCYECGWNSGLLAKDTGQDDNAVIAKAVREARAIHAAKVRP